MRALWEIAGLTIGVAGASAVAAALGIGTSRGLPAILSAGLLTFLVVWRLCRSPGRALYAGAVGLASAFAVDWFVAFVLGAGHLELRVFRRGAIYPVLMVLLFLIPAIADGRAARTSSSASAPP